MTINKFFIPKQILIILLLAVVLNITRFFMFESRYFVYLLWNIFLAIIPFIISSILLWYALKKRLTTAVFIVGGIIWILFLPNAPYLVTDIIHLGRNYSAPLLYDTFLVFTSAWVGLLLGLYSLSHIDKIMHLKYSKRMSSIILTIIILLTSFGMYLGRFLRFNSWDVVSNPSLLFSNIHKILSEPRGYTDAYIFTGLSFLFLYVSYIAWKSTKMEPKDNI